MLFMVVERFRDNDMAPIYRHMAEHGRGVPQGVDYIDSWVAADFSRGFQLMRADDPARLQPWVRHWEGLGVNFEIVPVVTSAEARAAVEGRDP